LDVQFIFIVGVEGCGHHGLFPVIETALKSSNQAKGRKAQVFTRWPPIRQLFELMQHGVELAHNTGSRQFVVEDNSFPSHMNRDPARQWDIVEMVDLLSPYADIKILALYRDPIATTFSHAEWDGGMKNHARLVATFLEYLNKKLLQLEPAIVKSLRYEDLVDNHDQLAMPLSDYLGLDVESIKTGFLQVHKSRKDWRLQMSLANRNWITHFFDNERLASWPLFTDPSYNLLGRSSIG